jgi:hypothetical protein
MEKPWSLGAPGRRAAPLCHFPSPEYRRPLKLEPSATQARVAGNLSPKSGRLPLPPTSVSTLTWSSSHPLSPARSNRASRRSTTTLQAILAACAPVHLTGGSRKASFILQLPPYRVL